MSEKSGGKKYCVSCGAEIDEKAEICPKCGVRQPAINSGQTIVINQQEKKSNGIGIAGFVLALVALFLGWVPVLGWIIWFLGLILSFIGVFGTPKGMAIAGLVISLIGLILLLVVFGALAASVAASL